MVRHPPNRRLDSVDVRRPATAATSATAGWKQIVNGLIDSTWTTLLPSDLIGLTPCSVDGGNRIAPHKDR